MGLNLVIDRIFQAVGIVMLLAIKVIAGLFILVIHWSGTAVVLTMINFWLTRLNNCT